MPQVKKPLRSEWMNEIADELGLHRELVQKVASAIVERWKRELGHRREVVIYGMCRLRPVVSFIRRPMPVYPVCHYCGKIATPSHLFKAHAMTWQEYKDRHGGLVTATNVKPVVRIDIKARMTVDFRRKLGTYGPMLELANQEAQACPDLSPNQDRPLESATATAGSASSS